MKTIKHEIEVLTGKTILNVSVQELKDKNGSTLQVVRLDHTEGTHWLVPMTFFHGKKRNEILLDVLNHEQYAELIEFNQE